MSIFNKFRFFGEYARDFAFQIEDLPTLGKLALNTKLRIESALKAISEEDKNISCSTINITEYGLYIHPEARDSVPELAALQSIYRDIGNFIREVDTYTKDSNKKHSVRIFDLYKKFYENYKVSKIKDLPILLATFTAEVNNLNNLL